MPNLSVLAAGMVTSVGFNYESSCAAIRAGISGARVTNLWDPEAGEPLAAHKVDLPHWWEGVGKLADLLAAAIDECLAEVAPIAPEAIPILLGIAGEDRPHRIAGLDHTILPEVEVRLEIPHHPYSMVIPRGNASGVLAIQQAGILIERGLAPACIVCGVDSFLQQNVVEFYMQERRVLTASNSNGFIPGEAGCAVVLGGGWGRAESLAILGMGISQEPATIQSDQPLRGEGITRAARQALNEAGLTILETSYRLTDLNGEHYKFKEAIFVEGRLMNRRYEGFYDLWHPIEYVGEIGAAVVPCLLAVALHAGRKRYAPGNTVLCHLGSDSGERGAMVLRYQQ